MALPTRVNRNAVDPYESAQRDFDNMLNRFFGGRGDSGVQFSPYGVDIREDADHFYVEAEMPGFRKDDVDITLENQTLTITAQRQDEQRHDGRKGELLLNERRYSRFQRSFTLPPTVNDQKVDAKLVDGVLTITLDKRQEAKPRKIQVS